MLVPRRMMPECSVPFYDPFVTTAGSSWVHGPEREWCLWSGRPDRDPAYSPPPPPSSGKGQALVCSGSDMPCLCRCHPAASHCVVARQGSFLPCHTSVTWDLWKIIQFQIPESLLFQNEHLLVYMRLWLHVPSHSLLTDSILSISQDMPKVIQLLGGRKGGYRGLSSHHMWLCAQTGQTHSWSST